MKVICIKSSDGSTLDNITIGKVYDSIYTDSYSSIYYLITNDNNGNKYWALKNHFITLEEWRAKQIESIL